MNKKIEDDKENLLKITRTFETAPERLFEAFLNETQLKQWWGPKGFTAPVYEADSRVGGKYLSCMRSPEGKDFWSTGTFIEIDAPKKIKYSDSFADEKGNVVASTQYGMSSNFPLECIIEISFAPEGDGTQLKLSHYGIPKEEIQNCTKGWEESLDKLEDLLSDSVSAKSTKSERRSESTESNFSI